MSIHSQLRPVQAVHVKSISSVSSPCIRVCKIEDDHCEGCGRSSNEIREWFYCDDQRKQEILEESGKRISSRMRGMRINHVCTG